jgi:putative phage-type endonuclease
MKSYELVCHDDDPRWLSYRFDHITASEMSAVMGMCPWSNRDDVLRRKVSRSDDFKATRNMWWGSELEQFNMEMFTKITGIRTRSCNAFLRSTKERRIAATIDGFALRPRKDYEVLDIATKVPWADDLRAQLAKRSGLGLIEMKNTEAWFGKKWHEAPPMHYVIQLQQQLYVTGLDWGILCGKLGAGDMIAYLIDADPFLHTEMEEDARSIWKEISDDRKDLEEYFDRT